MRFGEDRFHITASDDTVEIARGGADHPDATIESDPGALFAVFSNGRSLADAQRAGRIKVDGDTAAVQRLVLLFKQADRVDA